MPVGRRRRDANALGRLGQSLETARPMLGHQGARRLNQRLLEATVMIAAPLAERTAVFPIPFHVL